MIELDLSANQGEDEKEPSRVLSEEEMIAFRNGIGEMERDSDSFCGDEVEEGEIKIGLEKLQALQEKGETVESLKQRFFSIREKFTELYSEKYPDWGGYFDSTGCSLLKIGKHVMNKSSSFWEEDNDEWGGLYPHSGLVYGLKRHYELELEAMLKQPPRERETGKDWKGRLHELRKETKALAVAVRSELNNMKNMESNSNKNDEGETSPFGFDFSTHWEGAM